MTGPTEYVPSGYQYSQGRSRVLSAVYLAPLASSSNAVHAAVTDNGALQTVTTAITNPDMARNVSATVAGTGANITAVQVIVTGTNIYGVPITETLPAFTAATPGTVTGSKAFATVTSIAIPANGTGVTTAVGFGNKFGLPVKLSRNSVIFTFQDNVRETFAGSTVAVNATDHSLNTITFVGTPNGTHNYIADYYNNG